MKGHQSEVQSIYTCVSSAPLSSTAPVRTPAPVEACCSPPTPFHYGLCRQFAGTCHPACRWRLSSSCGVQGTQIFEDRQGRLLGRREAINMRLHSTRPELHPGPPIRLARPCRPPQPSRRISLYDDVHPSDSRPAQAPTPAPAPAPAPAPPKPSTPPPVRRPSHQPQLRAARAMHGKQYTHPPEQGYWCSVGYLCRLVLPSCLHRPLGGPYRPRQHIGQPHNHVLHPCCYL